MSDKELLPCPAMAEFVVVEAMLERHAHLHADPEAVRGSLQVTREVVERMHELLPCTPVVNQHGTLACSLGASINFAIQMLTQANIQASSAIQLDRVGKEKADDRTTGMYI
jgi:hypothetical protein